MKKSKIIFSIIVLIMLSINSFGQQIENIRIKTLEDKINIIFDITHEKSGQLFDIKVLCSDDGGENFNIELKSVSGDYGSEIEGGKDKIIIWDVLKDENNLIGENYVFKIIATPGIIKNQTDNVEGFYFELMGCVKVDNIIYCHLKVTNKGKPRDLKMVNRLARVYDFNGNRIESHFSKLGYVSGGARHSVPTLSFKTGQTELSSFTFKIPNGFSNRIKMVEFGVEVLEITYGLDLKLGNIQFKDVSYDRPELSSKAELISQAIKLNIGSEKIKDTSPPKITFSEPLLSLERAVKVKSEEVILKGKVTDENEIFEVTVNGMYASLKETGEFNADAYLVQGLNNIYVRAVDNFNNSIEKSYPIIYHPDRPDPSAKNPSKVDPKTAKNGKYYALIIGVSEYSDPEIGNLNQTINDANKLYTTLTTNYTFEKENISFLKNPTREGIISELDKLNKLIKEDDNLLVFYAGHGYWNSNDKIGYWLPSDAKKENTANWMRNTTIRDYLRTVQTKHTLLIADACFSGGIFKTRKAFTYTPKTIQEAYESPSRKAMTSGSLKEVPDESVFMLFLDKRLRENQKEFISAEELFSSFKTAVLNNGPNTPLYGEIKDTGDEGGDFIFVRRKN